MRGLVAVTVLVLLVSGVPQVRAQAAAPLLDDPAGDVQVALFGGQDAGPSGQPAALDLRSLRVAEGRDAFTVTLGLAGLDSPSAPVAGDIDYYVRLTHLDKGYQVVFIRSADGNSLSYRAELDEGQDDYGARKLEDLPVQVDAGANALTAEVPRARLLDDEGAMPFPGRSLSGINVTSSTLPIFGFDPLDPTADSAISAGDRMPDSGVGAMLPVALGDPQVGDARLASDDPVRLSNGEATTHAFTLRASNVGAAEGVFLLSVDGLPSGWQARIPLPVLRIPAGSSVNATVLVSTPFAHEHGAYHPFRAILERQGDAQSRAEASLGVRYTLVPQPAGHHDTLYLHAGPLVDNVRLAYMNTLDDDAEDQAAPVPAWNGCQDSPTQRTQMWDIPLLPALAMGLDFDLTRTGELKAQIKATRPLLGAVASGQLVHSEVGVLAQLSSSAPVDLRPGDILPLSLTVTPDPRADRVDYTKDKNLALHLTLTDGPGQVPSICPDAGLPELQPGGSLRLPLVEYHAPVQVADDPGLFGADAVLKRSASPGSDLVLHATLPKQSSPVPLSLFGVHAEWVTAPADAQGPDLPIVVHVPADAAPSDRLDAVLQATSADGAPSFLRVVVDVDPQAPPVHEALEAASHAKSPGVGAPSSAALLLGVAVIALRRRR